LGLFFFEFSVGCYFFMTAQPTEAPFQFEVLGQQGQARAGLLKTPHGTIATPAFMPVGTHGAVKMLTWPQVKATGAQIVLGNAYHLYLRPGDQAIADMGGLHKWMNWPHPILTDSGGFQVYSLAKLRKITEAGVHFKNPVDGQKHFIGPAESMRIQNNLGADIIMAFDECAPYPCTYDEAKAAMERTHRWLEQCFTHHQRPTEQALFPIVQGSTFDDLRQQSAQAVQQYPAVGYAIGGVSVGESKDWVNQVVQQTAPLLPWHKPRYLMGVGTPEDLLNGIRAGIDMFDCVMPTRIARHGSFFAETETGEPTRGIIKNANFTSDPRPLVEGCDCFTCEHHSRAYIRHLYRQKEATSATLLSIHNIHYLVQFAQRMRQRILDGKPLPEIPVKAEQLPLPQ
jgi:queuine tRNA-ribosyltransferase